MFIDTHCHLTFPQFKEDLPMVIGNAKKAGVKKFIIPGASIQTSYDAVNFVKTQKDGLYASVGCHPYETNNLPDIHILEKLLESRVVAVGECGLDYHIFQKEPAIGKKEEQKWLFEAQLTMAIKHNLPVIIHCRDAYEDIFECIDSLSALPKGVFHCFTGGLQDLKEVLRRGFFVGIDGNVTYSKQLAIVVPQIPLEKLLLETDSPYLPPEGHRGERSEPKYIPLIAKKIAALQKRTVKDIEEQTTKNAEQFFSLKPLTG